MILITDKEAELILRMCDDFGFEYSLKCTNEEVQNLKQSLLVTQNLPPPEMEEVEE
jgi:hypothetical protein